jgi:hypothetical protein
MTSPRLALDSDYGRLYCHPNNQGALSGEAAEDLKSGLLVPSVTNVIGILEKPHLYDWYARKATEAAMEVSFQHPGLITRKPSDARKWLSGAARRHMNDAADLGTRVHALCEQRAQGVSPTAVKGDERPFLDAWESFAADLQPEYLHVESTAFGMVNDGEQSLGYAGTADFIARIGRFTVVGDLKTGRSIHTEAALQLNALAHATEIVGDGDESVAPPHIDAGLVVHLTPVGYTLRVVPIGPEPMNLFTRLRSVWDFHTRNLRSTRPLLMGPAVSGLDALQRDLEQVARPLADSSSAQG